MGKALKGWMKDTYREGAAINYMYFLKVAKSVSFLMLYMLCYFVIKKKKFPEKSLPKLYGNPKFALSFFHFTATIVVIIMGYLIKKVVGNVYDQQQQ